LFLKQQKNLLQTTKIKRQIFKKHKTQKKKRLNPLNSKKKRVPKPILLVLYKKIIILINSNVIKYFKALTVSNNLATVLAKF
jgi:hypothetical protein